MTRGHMIVTLGLVSLAACDGPAPPPTPTPEELLDRAAEAMLAMASAKFVLVREGEPALLDPATGITFSEASGEYQAPDRVRASIKVSLFGNPVEIQMLWLPEGNYVTNPLTQAFEEAPPEARFDGAALFAPDGIPRTLRDGLQDVVLVGIESIEGLETNHLQGEAAGESLSLLTAGGLTGEASYPVDIWIETLSSNVVRVQVSEPDGNGWSLDLFDFNEPVEIQPP